MLNKRQFMMGIDLLERTRKQIELPDLKDMFEKNRHLTGDQWIKKCKEKMTSKNWDEFNKILF